jgi:hypothetical protein
VDVRRTRLHLEPRHSGCRLTLKSLGDLRGVTSLLALDEIAGNVAVPSGRHAFGRVLKGAKLSAHFTRRYRALDCERRHLSAAIFDRRRRTLEARVAELETSMSVAPDSPDFIPALSRSSRKQIAHANKRHAYLGRTAYFPC